MTRSRRRMYESRCSWGSWPRRAGCSLQQRGNNPFPGGPIPTAFDPRAADAPLHAGRLHRMRLLEPGSEQFRIRFLQRTRTGATEIVNATRGGSEGSEIEVYDPRTGKPMPFTYERRSRIPNARDSRQAADPGARRRYRPRAHLQDLQGPAHVHDERRRHRVGAQPERLPAGRAAAEGLRFSRRMSPRSSRRRAMAG